MNKDILTQYVDACCLIQETEEDIRRLRRKKEGSIHDVVSGSNREFPYQQTHFHLEGTQFTYLDDMKLRSYQDILQERKRKAEQIKLEVETIMNDLPPRMQRIIRFRFFDGLSWQKTAARIGSGTTADSLRMEFERFLSKK